MLPAVAIEALAEISLAIKQAHADEGDAEIGGALDVVAGQHPESAGIDRERLMHAKFGGKISHGARPQHPGMARTPGSLGVFVFAQAAIGVVDAAVQIEFGGARFEFGERAFVQKGDGAVIELAPTQRIKFAEQAAGIVIPTPPQVAGQRPETLLDRRDETVEGAGFAHHVRYPVRSLGKQANLIFREDSRLHGLNHQHALQHATIDQGNSQERLVSIFAGFAEILEARMIPDLFDSHWADLFRNQADQSFIDCHAKLADGFMAKPQGRGEHEIGAVRFEQVGGANIGAKSPGNQGDHVHQGFGRLAGLRRQVRDFLPGQHMAGIERAGSVVLSRNGLIRSVQIWSPFAYIPQVLQRFSQQPA